MTLEPKLSVRDVTRCLFLYCFLFSTGETVMGTFNTILAVLLFSCFFTVTDTVNEVQQITTGQVAQIEKGITLSKELLKGLDDVATLVTKSKEITDTIQKVLKVFDVFGKIASSFGFLGSLISLIFAFIPKSDPTFNFMKEQFSEVNRKLDSVSLQISELQTEMEWTNYASAYGKDENAIKNSWVKLKELMDNGPIATTDEQKSRLAEQFTSFYITTGTESSVANLYRYITESSAVSLNKNLLQLVIEKSNGDFKVLTQYSSYFTALMVSGLQMNVFYYKLKGYDAEKKANEAGTQLSNALLAIQDALIQCANDFPKWAEKDAQKLGTERFSDNKQLAARIKEHLEQKFIWYDWFVIAHSNDAKNEYTYGQSISFTVQDKTVVHLIHREKKATPDQTIVNYVKSQWLQEDLYLGECENMEGKFLQIFGARAVSHIQYLHAVRKPSDYAQTSDSDVELNCGTLLFKKARQEQKPFGDIRTINIFLKSSELVQNAPCSKVNCGNGQCEPLKDTAQGFCRCNSMYRGSTCEESIQNEIDYAATEAKINEIIIQPVPDLTAIFYSVKELRDYTRELVESVHQDIQWTQILIKYIDMIQKFRYIATFHTLLETNTIAQSLYISEVGAQFSGGNTFTFYLTQFNNMMKGTGFADRQNILDIFRSTFILSSKTKPTNPGECTKTYRNEIDHFVRFMFTLEKEAVLAWQKYLLATGKSKEIHFMEDLFRKFVSDQWTVLNGNGCGPLTAKQLDNNYCDKAYHSTDGLQVKLKCLGDYKPFPQTVQCSKGQWSALPVCYTAQVNGNVQCTSEAGATVCKASCSPGWGYAKRPHTAVVRCAQQPCPSFTPVECLSCTDNSVCRDHEVCERSTGTCRDGCLVAPCGVNAKCSYKTHQRICTCVSPWKGDPQTGCRSQDLKWIQTSGKPSSRSTLNLHHNTRIYFYLMLKKTNFLLFKLINAQTQQMLLSLEKDWLFAVPLDQMEGGTVDI